MTDDHIAMHKENLFKLLKNQVKQLVNVLLSSTKITPSYKKSLIFSLDAGRMALCRISY
jgi:hypothetical protein